MFDAQEVAHQQVEKLIEREFEELDMDHDGFITPEDLVAASRALPAAGHAVRLASNPSLQGKSLGAVASGDSPLNTEELAAVMHEVGWLLCGTCLTYICVCVRSSTTLGVHAGQ